MWEEDEKETKAINRLYCAFRRKHFSERRGVFFAILPQLYSKTYSCNTVSNDGLRSASPGSIIDVPHTKCTPKQPVSQPVRLSVRPSRALLVPAILILVLIFSLKQLEKTISRVMEVNEVEHTRTHTEREGLMHISGKERNK